MVDTHPQHESFLHATHDPHGRTSRLSEIILGGQDGLVNVLGIALGVAVATSSPEIVITAGLAATFAESISMAAVAYTSKAAESDFYESEREREYRHIHNFPNHERQEVRAIYADKGFEGDLLDRIVEKITADQHVWVEVMMAEEHQLTPINRRGALNAALLVGLSSLAGSLIPLMPFFFLPVKWGIWMAVALAGLVLFAVGAYKARVTVGRPGKSGLEMAAIGIVCALAGYLVGLLLETPGL